MTPTKKKIQERFVGCHDSQSTVVKKKWRDSNLGGGGGGVDESFRDTVQSHCQHQRAVPCQRTLHTRRKHAPLTCSLCMSPGQDSRLKLPENSRAFQNLLHGCRRPPQKPYAIVHCTPQYPTERRNDDHEETRFMPKPRARMNTTQRVHTHEPSQA